LANIGVAARLAWATAPGWSVALMGFAVFTAALPVAVTWATRMVVDALGSGRTSVLGIAVLLAGLCLVGAMLPHLEHYVTADFGRRIGVMVKVRLYHAVNRVVGLRQLESPAYHDELQLALQGGLTGPEHGVLCGLRVTSLALQITGFVGSLYLLNPWMVLVVLLGAVPTLLAELALNRRRAALTADITPAMRREMFYSGLLTGLPAAKEVRLFGLGGYLTDRMLGELRSINTRSRRLDQRQTVVHSGLMLLSALVAGAVLVWAVRSAQRGELSVGDVVLTLGAVAGVQGGVASLTGAVGETYQSMLVFDGFRRIEEAPNDLPVPEPAAAATGGGPAPADPAVVLASATPAIELRDVWFRYDDAHPWVLSGVNLTIPAGESVGLVGLNGAGKSTLVKLLCRFYDPIRGGIYWNGTDIRTLPVAQLRARIGAVFQDFFAYELSAAENIGVGAIAAVNDRSRIAAAAREAGCHETLATLPAGYDTLLTRTFFSNEDRDDPETGVLLSGGQWQRLALARALMRHDCGLLILDEPSSGLDATAEYAVHAKLRQLRVGRTSLLISHRLSAMRDASLIYVLDDGKVVEHGDHDELMAGDGRYAELFSLQARGYGPVPA
jgi:ATP-binding cassette subfamily B protein